jgi:DNA-binding transcriptional LysR family regulator
MDLSTDTVKTFVTLCELGSFSRTGKLLHKSQATVSAQIASLEERAGLQFFDRSERPLKLTTAGKIFYEFSVEFLSRLQDLDRLLKELYSGVMGDVRIVASTSIGAYLLPKLLAEIMTQSPKLKITLSLGERHEVCESVRRADCDFGIILSDKPPDELISKVLRKEVLHFIVSPEHHFAKKKKVTLQELRSAAFIGGKTESGWQQMIRRVLEQNGVSDFSVALRVNNHQAMKETIREGFGTAIFSHLTVQRELSDGTLCKLNVPDVRLAAEIMLIERERALSSPAVALIKSFLEAKISARPVPSLLAI